MTKNVKFTGKLGRMNPGNSEFYLGNLEAGFFGVAGAGAAVAVASGIEAVLEREHYRTSRREVLLNYLDGIAEHYGVVLR